GGAPRLVGVVVGHDARAVLAAGADAHPSGELAQPAGVLGGDQPGPLDRGQQPRLGVVAVADRDPGQRQRPAPPLTRPLRHTPLPLLDATVGTTLRPPAPTRGRPATARL